jgi:hypothetical protein
VGALHRIRREAAMTKDKTARVLSSAARWRQRCARKKSGADTKAAYREAMCLLNRPSVKPKEK